MPGSSDHSRTIRSIGVSNQRIVVSICKRGVWLWCDDQEGNGHFALVSTIQNTNRVRLLKAFYSYRLLGKGGPPQSHERRLAPVGWSDHLLEQRLQLLLLGSAEAL